MILIDFQHSQEAVFSFEKGFNHQNHSSGFLCPVKESPSVKFLIPPSHTHTLGGGGGRDLLPSKYLENPEQDYIKDSHDPRSKHNQLKSKHSNHQQSLGV